MYQNAVIPKFSDGTLLMHFKVDAPIPKPVTEGERATYTAALYSEQKNADYALRRSRTCITSAAASPYQ
jgi:hypothetical protein